MVLAVACICLLAESGPTEEVVTMLGKGVTAPKLLRQVAPKYSEAARVARVQGIVLCQVDIGADGRVADIVVMSPIGFGLEAKAEEAIRKWKFKAGEKDGRPVKVRATVEVRFRLENLPFDEQLEQRRTSLNGALYALRSTDQDVVETALKKVVDLADQGYPAAMFLLGTWKRDGSRVPRDPLEGRRLIASAADKKYGPALFEIGKMHIEGRELPQDPKKGLDFVTQAAEVGDVQARLVLGSLYEQGKGVPADRERALKYYRQCAAARATECQVRLAKMLMGSSDPPQGDYMQALAWLQLAADAGAQEARALLDREQPKLSRKQLSSVTDLKRQLLGNE